MKAKIELMKYSDIWEAKTICKTLSACNPEIGNVRVFYQLLYHAIQAKKITAIDAPVWAEDPINIKEYETYNFKYKKEVIIAWVEEKYFNLPKQWFCTNQTNSNEKIAATNLRIIAGLLHLILSEGSNGVKNSRFVNQSAVIEYLTTNVPLSGLSKRNLESRFSEANKILSQLN